MPQDIINSQHMRDDIIKQHQRHIQLLLVKHLQARRHVAIKVLQFGALVSLAEPVAEQQWALQGLLNVHIGKVLACYSVELVITPLALTVSY